MDYQKQYNQLISRATNAPHIGYTETHHIIPKCLGGDDSKSNLVKLSAKQHFVAHHLLFKIHGGSKLANAWYSMCRVGKGQEERVVNARLFEKVRVIRSKLLSVESMGELNHFFGKKHSEASLAKMSAAQKEMKTWERRSDKHREALLASQKAPKSAEHRAKIGRKNMIMLQNTISGEIIKVDRIDPRVDSEEWCNPRKINPELKRSCIHCNMVTTSANLKRWHDDKCKHKEIL